MAANSDEVLDSRAVGHRASAKRFRMTDDTVFRVPLLVRPLIAIAALQLVDSSALDLDDRLDEQVVRRPAYLAAQSGPQPAPAELAPHRQAPTLRQILARIDDPTVTLHDADISRAGAALERASGMRLDAYIRHNVLNPLAMHDTYFAPPASLGKRIAGIHPDMAPDTTGEQPTSAIDPSPIRTGRDVLCSTAPDSLKLLHALLRRDTGLLSEQSYQELARTRLPGRRSPDVLTYYGGFNTYCWVDRHSDTTGLLFTQVIPHEHRPLRTLFNTYQTAVRTKNKKINSVSRFARVLEYFSYFDMDTTWWI
jgi:CubicO group peptidase (beta-lactamase class C family)